jgi:hypothetical protein
VTRFEQGLQVLFACLGHDKISLTAGVPVALSSLPNYPTDLSRLRRVVARGLAQPWEWRADGGTPDGGNGLRHLADEVVVFDGEFDRISFIRASSATGNPDLRIAYFGT